ncbi:MAG: carboxynorspermidine decarboxylase [Candidatus Thiodiazotropha sp. 'RUGA']|nr:carboxynorspermidine decarboxylase [Candidatus Thiodiazotropha sp. 'RUGA']
MGTSWKSASVHCGSDSWIDSLPSTPAFVFDKDRINANLARFKQIRSISGCHVLYSIKACPAEALLREIANQVDGFSVSSLFEARLANEVTNGTAKLHTTTPGFRREEMSELGTLCETVSFNSLNQLQRLPFLIAGRANIGLRVNPQLSFLEDRRYDPCCHYSKLGAPLSEVVESWSNGSLLRSGLSGLHLHTNFGATSFAPLESTVNHLEAQLPELMKQIDWINLGGGYLFQKANDLDRLLATLQQIRDGWQAEVYLEPGSSIVDDAGMLVTTVIDRFESDGKSIAVLDTSVNHLPEVFEYQTKPRLHGENQQAPVAMTLVGSTCLSGDLFGDYRFDRPLQINDRIMFHQVGAYSLVKASRFNGLNLPSLCYLQGNRLTHVRRYHYEEYRQQWCEDDSEQQRQRVGL